MRVVDKCILCKTTGTKTSTPLATMLMQEGRGLAVMTTGIIMTITDTEAGPAKVVDLAMVVATDTVGINQ